MTFRSLVFFFFLLEVITFRSFVAEKNSITAIVEKNTDLTSPAKIDSLISKMSLEDKARLLVLPKIDNPKTLESIALLDDFNGFYSDDFIPASSLGWRDKPNTLNIFSGDSKRFVDATNIGIGASGLPILAQNKGKLISESLSLNGFTLFLSGGYGAFSDNYPSSASFHSLPSDNLDFWKKYEAGFEENKILLGNKHFLSGFSEENVLDFEATHTPQLRDLESRQFSIMELKEIDFKNIQPFLRERFKLNSVLIHDFSGNTESNGQINEVVEALEMGIDLAVVDAEILEETVKIVKKKFTFSTRFLNEKCARILTLRSAVKSNNKPSDLSKYSPQLELLSTSKSMVCVRNERILPFRDLPVGAEVFDQAKGSELTDVVSKYCHTKDVFLTEVDYKPDTKFYFLNESNFESAIIDASQSKIQTKILIADLSSLFKKRQENLDLFDVIIAVSDSTFLSYSTAIQAVFGAYGIQGTLPFLVKPIWKTNYGLSVNSLNRMKYHQPKYSGYSSKMLSKIDSIVQEALDAGAFPGCQVSAAFSKEMVFQKSFGLIEPNSNQKVNNETVYDLASITKVAGSIGALMTFQGKGEFSLDDKLKQHLPDLLKGSPYGELEVREILAHQSGLPAWIPFYLKTINNGDLNPEIYSNVNSSEYSLPVAQDIYIKKEYTDSIYAIILSQRLKVKRYKYSDLGYYFFKKIIEAKGQSAMSDYLGNQIYRPLGLKYMRYNPFASLKLENVAPTEDDRVYRKQLIRGYVHDPGSAMLGGVGGHAGLFSNANDLAILMQNYLDYGSYGGRLYFDSSVVAQYTKKQFEGNRRGAGFDRAITNGDGGPACSSASEQSFGHSGFTGTLTWVDPKYGINYVLFVQ
ncbi:MAG: beta-N-acetylhexosaminidase [Lentimonas sp.]|jgi:beta-N-acetylhexosaminidase